MPRISTDNYDTVAAWNGSQDLFVVEQPDGTKVATPAMVKQFIEAGNFTATGEVEDGHGNILKDMAKSADVNTALAGKQDTLTFDNVPTQNSNNPVKSSGIFSAIANLITHVAGETSITIPLSDSWTATIFGTISTTPISAILTVVSGGSVSVTDLTSNSLASKANISANVSNKTITLTSKNTDKFYVNIVK